MKLRIVVAITNMHAFDKSFSSVVVRNIISVISLRTLLGPIVPLSIGPHFVFSLNYAYCDRPYSDRQGYLQAFL